MLRELKLGENNFLNSVLNSDFSTCSAHEAVMG